MRSVITAWKSKHCARWSTLDASENKLQRSPGNAKPIFNLGELPRQLKRMKMSIIDNVKYATNGVT